MPIKPSRLERYIAPLISSNIRNIYLDTQLSDGLRCFLKGHFRKAKLHQDATKGLLCDIGFVELQNISLTCDGALSGDTIRDLPQDLFVTFIKVHVSTLFTGDEKALLAALSTRFNDHMLRRFDQELDEQGNLRAFWVRASKIKQVAMLLLSKSATGKTSFTALLRPAKDITIIHGDNMVMGIANQEDLVSDELRKACETMLKKNNIASAIKAMIAQNVFQEFLELSYAKASKSDFLFEMWVPPRYHYLVHDFFDAKRLKIVTISTDYQVKTPIFPMLSRVMNSLKKRITGPNRA